MVKENVFLEYVFDDKYEYAKYLLQKLEELGFLRSSRKLRIIIKVMVLDLIGDKRDDCCSFFLKHGRILMFDEKHFKSKINRIFNSNLLDGRLTFKNMLTLKNRNDNKISDPLLDDVKIFSAISKNHSILNVVQIPFKKGSSFYLIHKSEDKLLSYIFDEAIRDLLGYMDGLN